jgi:CBS domain-containing protein
VGILTDRDLYRRGVNEQAQVKVAMTQEPVTVSLVTPVERAALLMVHHRISGLPVLKDGTRIKARRQEPMQARKNQFELPNCRVSVVH